MSPSIGLHLKLVMSCINTGLDTTELVDRMMEIFEEDDPELWQDKLASLTYELVRSHVEAGFPSNVFAIAMDAVFECAVWC